MSGTIPIRVTVAKRQGTTKRTLRHQRIVSYLESVRVPKTLTEITDHLNDRSDGHVSRKTVERDILDLTDQYQIAQSPGRPAGFRIPEDAPREYLLELSDGDLQSLSLAICILRNESPDVFQELTNLLEAKILHKLPSRLRKEMERLSRLCVARGAASGRTKGRSREDIILLLKALRQGKAVRFQYESPYKKPDGRTRLFGLAVLEVFGGSFFFLAEDLEVPEGQSRIKRLALPRIRRVEVTDTDYQPPAPSSLRQWESSYGGLGGDKQDVQKIRLRCGHILGTYLSEHQVHPSQVIRRVTKGWEAEFELPIGSPFVRLLAGFAFDISAIEPPALEEEVFSSLRAGLKALRGRDE